MVSGRISRRARKVVPVPAQEHYQQDKPEESRNLRESQTRASQAESEPELQQESITDLRDAYKLTKADAAIRNRVRLAL
eukprot:6086417-Pleurochrysis_carterae.AAC.1